MSDVYGASDYAGAAGGLYSFYYGYEFVWCPQHGFIDASPHDDCADPGVEWAFEAKYDGKSVARYKASEIGAEYDETRTEVNVLRGIVKMLDDKAKK